MLGLGILLGAIGMVLVVMGVLLWKKQKISLLHSYHYDKVKKEDQEAFCAMSGMGVTIIGAGMVITGIVAGITGSPYVYIIFAASFVAGLFMLILAGVRYNR